MGSFFSKSNRRLDSIFMEGFEDDESLLIFNQQNNYNNDIVIRGIQELTNKIRNLESENKLLRGELNKYRNSINTEVYQINEKMNLVNKDLQSLLANDKILLQKYNDLEIKKNSIHYLDED